MKKLFFVILLIASICMTISCDNDHEEHTHSFGYWDVTKEATCSEDGLQVRYCGCNEQETEIIPATGHKEQIIEAVESTCRKTGLTEGKECSVCGEVLEAQQEIPLKDHTEETISNVESTCTKKGLTEGKKCSVCGEVLEAQQEIPLKDHTEETIPNVESTCTKKGLTEGKKCSVCGEVLEAQQETPLKAHTEVIDIAVEATCSKSGLSEGTHCSVCGVTIVEQHQTPVIAHTYDDKYDETCNVCDFVRDAECAHIQTSILFGWEATCTSNGLTDGSMCSKCHKIIVPQEIILSKGHNQEVIPGKYPTCTDIGYTEGIRCKTCNEVLFEQIVLDAYGHISLIKEHSKAPTCTEIGYTDVICCIRCEMILSDKTIIPAKGHTIEIEKTVEPTCTSLGATERKWCSVCCETLVKSEPIPMSDHTYIDGYCTVCNANEYLEKYFGFRKIYKGGQSEYIIYAKDKNNMPEEVIIPQSYKGYTIVRIDLSDCPDIVSLVISEGIKDISNAFWNCENLVSVTLPESIENIEGAFSGCKSLESIKLPASLENIGSHAFDGCESLSQIEFPEKLLSIDGLAFYGCVSLKDIIIPDGVKSIGWAAFEECTGLESLVISDSVLEIADRCFYGCKNLSKIIFGDGLVNIPNGAFYSCENVKEMVIGKNMESSPLYYVDSKQNLETVKFAEGRSQINAGFLSGCWKLKKVIIPNSVIKIGEGAFKGCESLTDIELPSSLKYIEASAFSYCNLEKIDIPDGVLSIGEEVFSYNTLLMEIFVPETVNDIGTDIAYETYATIYCQSSKAGENWVARWNSNRPTYYGVKDAGKTKEGIHWIQTFNDTIKIVGCFYRGEKSVFIPSLINGYPVTAIGPGGLENQQLTEIYIPDSVIDISSYAIGNSELLETVIVDKENPIYHSDGNCIIETATNTIVSGCNNSTIPEYVTSISGGAFVFCQNIKSIYLSENIKNIGFQAFQSCHNIIYCEASSKPSGWDNDWLVYHIGYPGVQYWGVKEKTTDEGLVWEEDKIIGYVGKSEKVFIPSSIEGNKITTIGRYAFIGRSDIKELVISDGIKYIGNNAFSGCGNLEKLVLPSNVIHISEYSFGFSTIQQVHIGDLSNYLLSSLSDSPVAAAKELYINGNHTVELIIPDNIICIPNNAFSNCLAIERVIIPQSVTSIGDNAFYGCVNLKNVIIPDSVETIGEFAFYNCYNVENLTIGNSVSSIGRYAFADCEKITSVTIPDSVVVIEDTAFYSCNALSFVKIGKGVERIEAIAFGRTNLLEIDVDSDNSYYKSIDGNLYTKDGKILLKYCSGKENDTFIIPDTVLEIASNAFGKCKSLKTIVIPAGVYSVCSFSGCISLENIIVDENSKYYKSIDGNLYSKDGTALIKYASGKRDTSFIIPDSVTCIGDYAFSGCTSLTEITLHGKYFGHYAFEGCTNLKNVILSEDMLEISIGMFDNCNSLQSIVIPDSVTVIQSAFAGCTNLNFVDGPQKWICYQNGEYFMVELTVDNLLFYSNCKWVR